MVGSESLEEGFTPIDDDLEGMGENFELHEKIEVEPAGPQRKRPRLLRHVSFHHHKSGRKGRLRYALESAFNWDPNDSPDSEDIRLLQERSRLHLRHDLAALHEGDPTIQVASDIRPV
jgi:hypothetical protein